MSSSLNNSHISFFSNNCWLHCYMIVDRNTKYLPRSFFVQSSINPFLFLKSKSIPLTIYLSIHYPTTHLSIYSSVLTPESTAYQYEWSLQISWYFIVSHSNRMKLTTWFIMRFSRSITQTITHSIIRGELEFTIR